MLQPSSSSSSSLSSPHHLPFHGDALFNRYSSREQACPPREGATSLAATVSPLHVASTCAVPAPAPGGHSCVFWKMGFGFFSNKNLFKKIHESESPLIPLGTPEEGKPALQPPHPSSTRDEAANTFGGASRGQHQHGAPPRTREQRSHWVAGDSGLGATHTHALCQHPIPTALWAACHPSPLLPPMLFL